MNPLAFLTGNPWAMIVLAASLFLAGLGAGVKLMSGQLGSCKQSLGEFKAAYAQLAVSAQKQNEAVAALEQAGKTARQKGLQARKEAEARGQVLGGEIARLSGLLASRTGASCSEAATEIRKAWIKERS